MNHRSITVYDIAKEAGVSPATVSRVLTGNANVSEEKKQSVLELIAKYDFEPNGLARSLSKSETKTIGMIIPDIRNPFYSTLFVECELEAAKYGYNMMLCNTIHELSAESIHLRNLMEKRVDAIIQVGGSVDEVSPDLEYIKLVNKTSKRIPIVTAGELTGANVYRIVPEPNHGMWELLTYLTNLGHKDIAFLGGRDSVIPTMRKRAALKKYFLENGLSYQREFVIDGDYTIEGGYETANKLFSLDKLPSVIIAINDIAAVGIIKAINEKGLNIPEDISVVGCDNTYFTEIITPRLTSISYNLDVYAREIIETVKNAIGGNEENPLKYIATCLVVRNSCK